MRACARTRADGGLGAHVYVCLIPAMCGAPLNEQYNFFARTFESFLSKKKQTNKTNVTRKERTIIKIRLMIFKGNEKCTYKSGACKLCHQ